MPYLNDVAAKKVEEMLADCLVDVLLADVEEDAEEE